MLLFQSVLFMILCGAEQKEASSDGWRPLLMLAATAVRGQSRQGEVAQSEETQSAQLERAFSSAGR